MARPTPRYISSTSPNNDIPLTPEHSQPSATSQHLQSGSDTTPFNLFNSLHPLPHSPFGPTLYRKSSQQFSNIDLDSLPDQEQQQGIKILQTDLGYTLGQNTDIPQGSQVLKHQPWNPVDALLSSMRPQLNTSMLRPEHAGRRLHTDSAYGSDQRLDQRPSSTHATYGSGTTSQNLPYDAPIGSTAAQNQLLPDQRQHQPPSPIVIPPSPTALSTTATEATPTASNNGSFRCEDCSDLFSTKSELTKHMARHNKKHVCNHKNCPRAKEGQGFATKNDLDRHKANVHDDKTVPKKSYRCCVLGCKDPEKLWNRKDNFKAHVARMHPDEDSNDIVNRSLQDGIAPRIDELPYSYGAPELGQGQQLLQIPRSGSFFPPYVQSQHEQNYHNDGPDQSTYGQSHNIGTWDEIEGDMYESSLPNNNTTFSFGSLHPASMNPNPYQDSTLSSTIMLRPQHTGASDFDSNTIMAPTTQPDNLAPQILPRHMSGSFPPRMYMDDLPQIPPYGAQTAPIAGDDRDDIFQANITRWTDQFQQSPVADTPIAKIDPSLGAGAWEQSLAHDTYAPPMEIPDQSFQPLLPSSEVQPNSNNSNQTINQHRADLRRKVTQLLETLSDTELESTFEAYQRHPNVANKKRCIVKSALEKLTSERVRPFKCSREGCYKTFSKKNVCTKHEKRHDRSFFCTFDGCDKRFGSKHDLRRHERQLHKTESFHGWRCFVDDVPTSQHKPECFRFFNNEDDFVRHRRNDHKERAVGNGEGLRAVKKCRVHQGGAGPFWCGFCNKVIPNEANGIDGTELDKTRYDHIDHHVTKEKKRMQDWTDLKSEGLKKTQVMEQSRAPKDAVVPNDESDEDYDDGGEEDDDDDEYESPSAEVSTTIANSVSQPLAHTDRLLDLPQPSSTNRKRSHSQTKLPSQGGPSKLQRTGNYTMPRQAVAMSRGASDMAMTGPIPLGMDTNVVASHQLTTQCCRCGRVRPINGGLACSDLSCMHTPCHYCLFWNSLGKRVYARRHHGGQPDSNN